MATSWPQQSWNAKQSWSTTTTNNTFCMQITAISENRVANHFLCSDINNKQKIRLSMMTKKLTLQPWQYHGDGNHDMQSNHDQQTQQTASFACEWQCHFWEQSHQSHVLHMGNHDHQFLCQSCQQQYQMGGSSFFYAATSIFSCFWCETHCCDPLAKAVVCM